MNSNEPRHPDKKLLIPEASLKDHWRNTSTSFEGTEFCLDKKKKKKKLNRTLSTRSKKGDPRRSKLKRCKSSPLNANEHELLEEFKPREIRKRRSSIIEPHSLPFLSEKSTNKKNDAMEIEKTKIVVVENSNKKAIANTDLHKARPPRKISGLKQSAPARVGELSNTDITFRKELSKENGVETDVNDFGDQIKIKGKEISKISCPDVIEDENVKCELLPEVEPPKDREIENGLVSPVFEESSSITNLNLITEASSRKKNGMSNKLDVHKCRQEEEEASETKIEFQAIPAKSNGSDMNPDNNQGLEIEKPKPVDLHLEAHVNKSCELKKPDAVIPNIISGSCEIEKTESPLHIQLDGKESHVSEEPCISKDQLCPSKETSNDEPISCLSKETSNDEPTSCQSKETTNDEPTSISNAGAVKKLTSKWKHENSSESCGTLDATTNEVNEANNSILNDGLLYVDESSSGNTKDISKKNEVEPRHQVNRVSSENDRKDASNGEPISCLSKETSNDEPTSCPSKETSNDEPTFITSAVTVKKLTSKWKHENSSESCGKPHATTNEVDEANNRILNDGLLYVDESSSGNPKDICEKNEVEPRHHVHRVSTKNDRKDAPVLNVSKETTSNKPNCRNEKGEVQLRSTIIPQSNYLEKDEPKPEIKQEKQEENFNAITESPRSNFSTPVKNSDIVGTNQVSENLDKSTCTSANKSEIEEINQIHENLRGIQNKWVGDIKKVETFRRWSAPGIRRLLRRKKDERYQGANLRNNKDVFREAAEGVKRNLRLSMSDARQGEDFNISKKDELKGVAVKKAAQEAADDVWPKRKLQDPPVKKVGGMFGTLTRPATQSFVDRSSLGWSCTVCTYLNSTGDICEMCLLGRRQRQNEFKSESFHTRKKSMVSSMKRMWWKKLGNRNK